MHTARTIALAHGRTIRTVKRWIKEASEAYPDMGWPSGRGRTAYFSDEQLQKILEFAPLQPEVLPKEDHDELTEGRAECRIGKERSGLALRSPITRPASRFIHGEDGDLEQAKTLASLHMQQANSTAMNIGAFLGEGIVRALARDAEIIYTNATDELRQAAEGKAKSVAG